VFVCDFFLSLSLPPVVGGNEEDQTIEYKLEGLDMQGFQLKKV
jgi:hypothetical protein